MKVTIQPTTKIVVVDGIQARVWEGTTEAGIPVALIVSRITPMIDPDVEESKSTIKEFSESLKQVQPPSAEVQMWPLRLIL